MERCPIINCSSLFDDTCLYVIFAGKCGFWRTLPCLRKNFAGCFKFLRVLRLNGAWFVVPICLYINKIMNQSNINKTTLSNGVRILSMRMPQRRTVSLGVWVETGARDESPAENGFAHFIEHMVFKGSPRRSAMQIALEFDALGGQANAFTSMEHTCYHAKTLDEKLPQLADVLFDMVLNASFDAAEIRRERPVVLQEIGMVEDDPEDYLHQLANRAFWHNSPLANSILGSRSAVRKFNREDITAFFRERYTGDRIIVTAAGNVEHAQLAELAAPYFTGLASHGKAPSRILVGSTPHRKIISRDTEQANIYLSLPGESVTSEKRFALNLLNMTLGSNMSSRLYQEIREKQGLAYSVYSFLSSFCDTGMLSICLGVAPRDTLKALDLIGAELDKLKTCGITEAERENALSFMQSDMYLASESCDSQMSRLAQTETSFGRYVPLEETLAAFKRVSHKEILDLARAHFDPACMGTAILGPLRKNGRPL